MLFITIVSALFSAVLAAPAAPARPNTPPRDQLRISKLTFQSTDTGIGDAHDFKFQLQVGSVMVQCNDLPGPKTNFHSREVDCHNKDFTVFVQDFGTQKLLHVKFLDREAGQEKVAWNIAPSYKCPKGSGVKLCKMEHGGHFTKLSPGPFPLEQVVTIPRQGGSRGM